MSTRGKQSKVDLEGKFAITGQAKGSAREGREKKDKGEKRKKKKEKTSYRAPDQDPCGSGIMDMDWTVPNLQWGLRALASEYADSCRHSVYDALYNPCLGV